MPRLGVKTAMAARMSKDGVKLTAANARTVPERAAASEVASEAQPVSPAKSAALEAQIATGQALMARYQQTFEALAK